MFEMCYIGSEKNAGTFERENVSTYLNGAGSEEGEHMASCQLSMK